MKSNRNLSLNMFNLSFDLNPSLLDPLFARVGLSARKLDVGLREEAAEVSAVHEVGVQLLVLLIFLENLAGVLEALNVPESFVLSSDL